MKKKSRRAAAACFCAAGMALQGAFVSHGGWQTDGVWWQYSPPGVREAVRSSWHQVEGQWYWFDENGFMKTGWHLDADGRWYFLNPVSDGTRGRMMTGWQWIDGYCYYLSEKTDETHPLGAMYENERTWDGYPVGKSGAWVDGHGSPVYRSGKGIITKASKMESYSKSQTGSFHDRSEYGAVKGGTQRSEQGKEGQADSVRLPDVRAEARSGCETISICVPEGRPSPAMDKPLDSVRDSAQETVQEKKKNKVSWQIHFTDSSARQVQLAPSKSGTAEEGADLTIYFQSKIIDAENRIWKSIRNSPYVITITGPQDRIIYVEYEEIGRVAEAEDPWQEEKEHLQACMEVAKKQERLFLGSASEEILDSRILVEDKKSCDMRLKSAAGRIEPGRQGAFYVIGKNYIPEGSVLSAVYGDGMEYSNTVEEEVTAEGDVYLLTRFQLYRKPQTDRQERRWSANDRRHWKVGDVQRRELDGVLYDFRCIDQNYGDETDRGRQKALFLCDAVIPADRGSSYSYEKGEDGLYRYRFHPGPVVSFGDSDSYKHSRIRKWLKHAEADFMDAAEISTGVSYAYEGSTREGSGKSMSGQGLKAVYIGSQAATDRLFILSVDEAIQYASWLWRFQGEEEENPQSQQQSFCKSYWLRNPAAGKGGEEVYVVDLLQKNIHSQSVKPKGGSGDPELDVTGSTGVRPAFAVEQQ